MTSEEKQVQFEVCHKLAIETERRLSILETDMNNFKTNVEDIQNKLSDILETVNKNKGFWAGIVFASTAFAAALGALLSYIFKTKLGG